MNHAHFWQEIKRTRQTLLELRDFAIKLQDLQNGCDNSGDIADLACDAAFLNLACEIITKSLPKIREGNCLLCGGETEKRLPPAHASDGSGPYCLPCWLEMNSRNPKP